MCNIPKIYSHCQHLLSLTYCKSHMQKCKVVHFAALLGSGFNWIASKKLNIYFCARVRVCVCVCMHACVFLFFFPPCIWKSWISVTQRCLILAALLTYYEHTGNSSIFSAVLLLWVYHLALRGWYTGFWCTHKIGCHRINRQVEIQLTLKKLNWVCYCRFLNVKVFWIKLLQDKT